MNNLIIYNQFQPVDVFHNVSIDHDLMSSFSETNLLVIGEIHGVKENADVLYSLVTQYGADIVAIERPEESYKNFIDSVLKGKPNFDLAPANTFDGSMLSLEMIKTLQVLYAEKKIKAIEFIGVDDISNVEKDLADNILGLDRNKKTICIMGNWHTTIEQIEVGDDKHISALMRAREKKDIAFVEYKYGRGQLYNAGTGLVKIESDDESANYKIERLAKDNFMLFIPVATPISH